MNPSDLAAQLESAIKDVLDLDLSGLRSKRFVAFFPQQRAA